MAGMFHMNFCEWTRACTESCVSVTWTKWVLVLFYVNSMTIKYCICSLQVSQCNKAASRCIALELVEGLLHILNPNPGNLSVTPTLDRQGFMYHIWNTWLRHVVYHAVMLWCKTAPRPHSSSSDHSMFDADWDNNWESQVKCILIVLSHWAFHIIPLMK